MFTENDLQQIKKKGITLDQVNAQVSRIKNGMSYSNLIAAATISEGIEKYTDVETKEIIEFYQAKQGDLNIVKFVPASGAATRMFKFLFKFLKDYNPNRESLNAFINKNNFRDLALFLVGLEKFPFYNEVVERLKSKNIDFDQLSSEDKASQFVKMMLDEDQLNFGNSPKGLLPFHRYKSNHISTAFEEHLVEASKCLWRFLLQGVHPPHRVFHKVRPAHITLLLAAFIRAHFPFQPTHKEADDQHQNKVLQDQKRVDLKWAVLGHHQLICPPRQFLHPDHRRKR